MSSEPLTPLILSTSTKTTNNPSSSSSSSSFPSAISMSTTPPLPPSSSLLPSFPLNPSTTTTTTTTNPIPSTSSTTSSSHPPTTHTNSTMNVPTSSNHVHTLQRKPMTSSTPLPTPFSSFPHSIHPLSMPPPQPMVRVEPKVYFANERTFLSWLNFTLLIVGLSLGLLNFGQDPIGRISGILFTLIAMMLMVYALILYLQRGQRIRKRLGGPYDSTLAPILVVCVLVSAILINFSLRLMSPVPSLTPTPTPTP